ncbi:MAG: metal-dependent hydrolase [Pseudomonadales bacterium]|nr:metal-dependent hydrolase [Pseudomonadales bacterium]
MTVTATILENTPLQENLVPIRHMKFEFNESKAAKYCWNNNAWGSAYIMTFSALIPAGERFVIEAVREFRDKIDDDELKARVTGLIGQEATHSKVHEEFNNMYDLKGFPINELERLGERVFVDFLYKRLPKKTSLAMACAIEHVTAIMAEDAFGHNPEMLELFDDVARDFLTWHLLEELEHKSVAYDLYEEVDGGYLHRVLSFLLIWSIAVPIGLYSVDKILKTPSFSQGKKNNRRGAAFFSKSFLSFSPNFLAYFRRDFHPDKIDTKETLHVWRAKLFGKRGQFNKMLSKTITPKLKRSVSQQRLAS